MDKRTFYVLAATLLVILGGITAYSFTRTPGALPVFGAVSGPDQTGSDHYSENGITSWPASAPFTQGTTTVCAIPSPAATSTLTLATFASSNVSTTTSVLTFALAANRYATTTQLGTNYAIAANSGAYVVSSTTNASGSIVIGPSQWVVMSLAGAGYTFFPTGQCQVRFTTL